MKKIKYILPLLALALVALPTVTKSQQTLRFSNYMFNKLILNPGAAGSNEYMEIMGSYRKQWVGFNGSPSTSFLSYDGAILQRRMGVGIQLIHDEAGALNSNGAVATAATRVRVSQEGFISFGISLGMFSNTLKGSDLTYKDQTETAIPAVNEQVNVFDFKGGLYYKDRKNFAGISVFNLFEPKMKFSSSPQAMGSTLERHYYFLAGRIFSLNPTWDIIPSLLYKTSESGNQQLDINARAMYKNFIGFGASYRNKESIAIMAEFLPTPFLRFGYAFDYSTNGLQDHQSGSHEVMVAYRFIPNKKLTENPRYLFK